MRPRPILLWAGAMLVLVAGWTALDVARLDHSSVAITTVARVVDGDTVELTSGDTVRLIGIDTPEQGECGYAEATQNLADLVDGERIELEPGARDNTDRYGRLLRYVEVDGQDAGLVQIQAGLARTRYDSRDGYGSHPKEQRYIDAEAITGLPVCVPGLGISDTPGVVSGGYPFCAAAKADGATPLHDGDAGWNPELDRDRDGVACE